jgi:polyisoprenyl-teichoic acid--peptidoglycan teichoic acid transferase
MKYADLNTKPITRLEPEKKSKGGIILVAILATLLVLSGLVVVFRNKIREVFDPVAIVANVAASELESTDGRTNVLILGSDQRSEESVLSKSTLTDTVLVASIGRIDSDVVLISLPRDLWVNWTDSQGNDRYSKLNAVYPAQYGGSEQLSQTIEDVLGMPVHYYTLVTFDMFKEVIDLLGGVDVTVDNSFTDYFYPVEGKENAPQSERYETVQFIAGTQTMGGDIALKFVRSRKGDNGEGTDFARSKRQQKVIGAIKEKAFSIQTLVNPAKLKSLYETYKNNVDTNIDFSTIQSFYLLSQEIDYEKIISVVLDDRSQAVEGGLLYAPEDTSLYGGAYVLLPQTGDYDQIHAYVQKYLFGDRQ